MSIRISFYISRVVGVELGQSLAQKLAFTQPYRMPVRTLPDSTYTDFSNLTDVSYLLFTAC